MKPTSALLPFLAACLCGGPLAAAEYHVAITGDDAADGSAARPWRTIQSAADRARPGDTVTVHAGIYRERVDPPRGGSSDDRRIVYQAAPGEKVTLKGSELVKGWEKVEHDTWKVTLPNVFFGDFNPYADPIRGDWFRDQGRPHHTGAVYLDGHWLTEAAKLDEVLAPPGDDPLWFAAVDDARTTIWAQLAGVDPNRGGIEINVRQAVFYPSRPGRDFITVRGFTLEHAATNWAPPTAEQVGLVGTHWSKGWVIEDNVIRYSVCTGVTLGKHGDEFDNTSANSAEGYVETIKRGLAAGWSKENIGSHVVRNNHISHCEQAGIVGSLGPAFSLVEGNHIHDIHVRQLFGGAEMAGIKFHGAIDTIIRRNHIHRCNRGIWLDWMTQGTRVTRNLVHDIGPAEDLFLEVNHGPFLIDHNLFLSERSLADWSEGGAYVHNLFAGKIIQRPELRRETPWQEEHGTKIAGLANTKGGDNRFFNNVFIAPAGLDAYDDTALPNRMAGNVFLKDGKLRLVEKAGVWMLKGDLGAEASGPLVTSELLGKAAVTGQPYVEPDGSPYTLDRDFFGAKGTRKAGPFSDSGPSWKVWP